MRVWTTYTTDLGKAYSLVPAIVTELEGSTGNTDPISLFPDLNLLQDVRLSCSVPDLSYRYVRLFLADGGRYEVIYPLPFNQYFLDSLSNSLAIQAFELVGERIKYSRLKRFLYG